MKSFRIFVESDKKKSVGVFPSVSHGSHSKPKKKELSVGVFPMVSHGSHSIPKTKQKLKEQYTEPATVSTPDWAHKNDNDHIDSSVSYVSEKLDHDPDEFTSIPDHQAVKEYTDHSRDLNKYLIGKHNGEDPYEVNDDHDDEWDKDHKIKTKEMLENRASRLDNALRQKALKHDLHVYHGARFDPSKLPGAKVDSDGNFRVINPAFMSTSIAKSTALDFAGSGTTDTSNWEGNTKHVLHIHLKPGQHGIYAGSNSSYPSENEFIMPRNTRLRVHHRPTVLRNGTRIWHAHVDED
jgi:hypothetical protein